MRAYWILPNRDQGDDILASDGEKIAPLRQILEPRLRPEGFSHGVPTEILERCGPKQFAQVLFAQRFPDWNASKQLFSVTSPAGVDSSGRVVHLGVLFILEPHEAPSFDLPYAGLSEQDQPYARALTRRLASPQRGDSWAQSVRELSELPSRRGAATNVELQRSVATFYSLYTLGPGGLTRKVPTRSKLRTRSTIILILFAAIGIWLAERACQHSPRPLVWSAAER
jgi:hypothetical protein